MKQFSYVLTRQNALHARSVGNLMREAARFHSGVELMCGDKHASLKDARTLLGGLAGCGSSMTVRVEGKDEEAAVAAIQNYFVANM